jgi:hypothetical protein
MTEAKTAQELLHILIDLLATFISFEECSLSGDFSCREISNDTVALRNKGNGVINMLWIHHTSIHLDFPFNGHVLNAAR